MGEKAPFRFLHLFFSFVYQKDRLWKDETVSLRPGVRGGRGGSSYGCGDGWKTDCKVGL